MPSNTLPNPFSGSADVPGEPRTRLAPSPTGALHLGNARTFLINWALAKQRGWRVVLRIEDLDGPRVKPKAADGIERTLEWLGLTWDEGPIVQSSDLAPYQRALRSLAARSLTYSSGHTRGELEDLSLSAPQEGAGEPRFPPELRPSPIPRCEEPDLTTNWRLATSDEWVEFDDEFQGSQRFSPYHEIGDFVIWTKRATPAYQLAVVVDDHRQRITNVVRGDDLLPSAARQLLLYKALGLGPPPSYLHVPLVRGMDGKRLAKRHGDTRVDSYRALGVGGEWVVGLVGAWCGIGNPAEPVPMTASEFAQRFSLDKLPREDVVFRPEHDAWLRTGSAARTRRDA
jgi:glutamyl-tRNA synthetase